MALEKMLSGKGSCVVTRNIIKEWLVVIFCDTIIAAIPLVLLPINIFPPNFGVSGDDFAPFPIYYGGLEAVA